MRFIYLFFTLLATANLIIILLSSLLGVNIYKKYGKQLLKGFCKFLLILIAMLIAIAISGLSS